MTTSLTAPVTSTQALLCHHCATPIADLYTTPGQLVCPHCQAVTSCKDGIWRCLTDTQASRYDRFITEYEFIRAAEGRGHIDPAYYRALPDRDLSGKLFAQWKIRARTFHYLERHILQPLAARTDHPLRILDLGAGNGWLSHRLALLGHAPVAVDLLTNQHDGLGAATHFAPTVFPRVQASLDHLPFAAGTFDLAIFNASFHYAENFADILQEALRCLLPGGLVLIADTPWYARESSGLRMVQEKHQRFLTTYGFASNSIPSQEFLTPARLDSLAQTFGLRWTTHRPFYGVAWSLRPLRARLQRRRPPSHFHIHLAIRGSA
jgi:SAM-dependent methyltransferase